MPVHPVPGGYRWGFSGKVYKTRVQAEAQARAIYASGWREDTPKGRRTRRELARLLSASRRAEGRYVLDLVAILRGVHRWVEGHVDGQARPDERHDAIKLPDHLNDQVAKHVRRRAGVAFERMAEQVKKNGDRASTLLGISPAAAGLGGVIANAREENIRLVERAGRAYAGDVRAVLEDPANEGLRVEELRDLLLERGRVSVSRATLIARDQTLKLNAGLNEHRQRAAGVAKYTWSTSHDDRVRPRHRELDGQEFSWDDPPETNDDGETNHPGEDFQCRCIAIPVLEELEEPEPDEPEEEGEQLELPIAAPANEVEEPEPDPEPSPLPEVGLVPADAFRDVFESPVATMTASEVVETMPHQGVKRWLATEENRPALRVEKKLELRGAEGYWHSPGGRSAIAIATDVPPPEGANGRTPRAWGNTWRLADTRTSVEAKVRSSFMHELGHHVHLHTVSQATRRDVDRIVHGAFEDLYMTRAQRAEILRGGSTSPAISRYAVKNPEEYFAESFNAYLEEPAALEKHDAGGFKMVREVLQRLGIE